jgi:hypothetical protein
MTQDQKDNVASIQIRRGTSLGHFGIGCLQFRPKDDLARFDSFNDYVSALDSSLRQIAAIQSLEITSDNTIENFSDGLPAPFPLLSDSEYPTLSGSTGVILEIKLRLAIPDRTQKQILDIFESARWKAFGVIDVFLSYQFDMPITVIYLDGVTHENESSPSNGVVLVREFLKTELESNSNCKFTIDVMGPSPFHADFAVQRRTDIEEYKEKRRNWGAWRRMTAVLLSPFQSYDLVSKIAEFRLTVMTAQM